MLSPRNYFGTILVLQLSLSPLLPLTILIALCLLFSHHRLSNPFSMNRISTRFLGKHEPRQFSLNVYATKLMSRSASATTIVVIITTSGPMMCSPMHPCLHVISTRCPILFRPIATTSLPIQPSLKLCHIVILFLRGRYQDPRPFRNQWTIRFQCC